jgi:hypothetical protein
LFFGHRLELIGSSTSSSRRLLAFHGLGPSGSGVLGLSWAWSLGERGTWPFMGLVPRGAGYLAFHGLGPSGSGCGFDEGHLHTRSEHPAGVREENGPLGIVWWHGGGVPWAGKHTSAAGKRGEGEAAVPRGLEPRHCHVSTLPQHEVAGGRRKVQPGPPGPQGDHAPAVPLPIRVPKSAPSPSVPLTSSGVVS